VFATRAAGPCSRGVWGGGVPFAVPVRPGFAQKAEGRGV